MKAGIHNVDIQNFHGQGDMAVMKKVYQEKNSYKSPSTYKKLEGNNIVIPPKSLGLL